MKNADRLTGSITKSDGKVLVIKTDYAGDVTVKFDAIQSITSTGDLNVSLGGQDGGRSGDHERRRCGGRNPERRAGRGAEGFRHHAAQSGRAGGL